jgi:hypothetical protein
MPVQIQLGALKAPSAAYTPPARQTTARPGTPSDDRNGAGTPALPSPFASSTRLARAVGDQDASEPRNGKARKVRIAEDGANRWYASWRTIPSKVARHRWFAWIPAKWHWPALKPVIRCTVAVGHAQQPELTQLWICWVLQLIPQTQEAMGFAACEQLRDVANQTLS